MTTNILQAVSVLVVLVVMVVVTGGVDPCEPYANGCSLPLGIPMFYQTLFTPSCNRHDVCYRCGARYSISKSTCDSAFLNDMEAACVARDTTSRRDLPLSLSSLLSPSHDVQKRSTCTVFADNVFYAAVHLFGGLFYRDADEVETFCSQSAAIGCLPS